MSRANRMAVTGARMGLANRTRRLEVLQRISRAVSSSLNMDEIYAVLAAELRQAIPFDRVSVALLTSGGDAVDILQPGAVPHLTEHWRLEDTVLTEVVKTGKPRITPDIVQDLGYPTSAEHLRAGLRSRINVPLSAKGRLLGTLNLLSRDAGCYSEADLSFLEPVADQLALALDNARVYQAAETRATTQAAINRIARAMATSLDMKTIYAALAIEILQVLPYDRISVALLTPEMDALTFLQPDVAATYVMPQRQALNGHPLADVMRAGRPQVTTDLEVTVNSYPALAPLLKAGLRSSVSIPLAAKGRVMGTMNLFSREVGHFSEADLEFLQPIADHLAVTLDNARLFEQVQAAKQDWEATFDAASDGMSVHTPDFRIVRANKSLANLAGSSPQALVGQLCFRVMHGCAPP